MLTSQHWRRTTDRESVRPVHCYWSFLLFFKGNSFGQSTIQKSKNLFYLHRPAWQSLILKIFIPFWNLHQWPVTVCGFALWGIFSTTVHTKHKCWTLHKCFYEARHPPHNAKPLLAVRCFCRPIYVDVMLQLVFIFQLFVLSSRVLHSKIRPNGFFAFRSGYCLRWKLG